MTSTLLRTRLTKKDLAEPVQAWIQHGEAFDEIDWDTKPSLVQLSWGEKANLNNEPGILINGRLGYAGWNKKGAMYNRYRDCGSDDWMRVVKIVSAEDDTAPVLSTLHNPALLTRLTQADLPRRARVQHGEGFSSGIDWEEPVECILSWEDDVNPNQESGICTGSSYGYAGFNAQNGNYGRYAVHGNEHYMRVLELLESKNDTLQHLSSLYPSILYPNDQAGCARLQSLLHTFSDLIQQRIRAFADGDLAAAEEIQISLTATGTEMLGMFALHPYLGKPQSIATQKTESSWTVASDDPTGNYSDDDDDDDMSENYSFVSDDDDLPDLVSDVHSEPVTAD